MKTKNTAPARSKLSVLRQLLNLIPPHLVAKLAREHGVDKKARTFSAWSHVTSLVYAQMAHSIGLNDVCDSLHLHSGALSTAVNALRVNFNFQVENGYVGYAEIDVVAVPEPGVALLGLTAIGLVSRRRRR